MEYEDYEVKRLLELSAKNPDYNAWPSGKTKLKDRPLSDLEVYELRWGRGQAHDNYRKNKAVYEEYGDKVGSKYKKNARHGGTRQEVFERDKAKGKN